MKRLGLVWSAIVVLALFVVGLGIAGRDVRAASPRADRQELVPSPVSTSFVTATPTVYIPPTATLSATPTCAPAWNRVISPTLQFDNGSLQGVKVISTNDAWSVGYYITQTQGLRPDPSRRSEDPKQPHSKHVTHSPNVTISKALASHWNGSTWTTVPLPNAGLDDNYLFSVTALASNDVWAAGYYINAFGVAQTLVEHWNGTAWAIVPSPNAGPLLDNQLFSIYAVASNNIWAIGTHSNDLGVFQTLALHYDGSTWQIVPTPNLGVDNDVLYGVSAASAGDVWAVGYYVNEAHISRTLVLHWNGSAWSVSPSPSIGSGGNSLQGIDALSASDAWAVGSTYSYVNGSPVAITLHWDGTTWTAVALTGTHGIGTRLNAVHMIASNDVWAVGATTDYSGGSQPSALSAHWDGTEWRVVRTAAVTDGAYAELFDVDSIASQEPWAVGRAATYTSTYGYSPIIERYSTQCIPSGCNMYFRDVSTTDYFYFPVLYLYCHEAISGYDDATFRPYNNVTRGQLTKILVLAEGWSLPQQVQQDFSDVPPWDPFYIYVEAAYSHAVISGYADHTFRPGNPITRGQLSKVIVLAQGWALTITGGPHFTDVPSDHPFYAYIETIYSHNGITGYGDNTFRPSNSATRGQVSRILFSTLAQP